MESVSLRSYSDAGNSIGTRGEPDLFSFVSYFVKIGNYSFIKLLEINLSRIKNVPDNIL